jgi:hypothetical protein
VIIADHRPFENYLNAEGFNAVLNNPTLPGKRFTEFKTNPITTFFINHQNINPAVVTTPKSHNPRIILD